MTLGVHCLLVAFEICVPMREKQEAKQHARIQATETNLSKAAGWADEEAQAHKPECTIASGALINEATRWQREERQVI